MGPPFAPSYDSLVKPGTTLGKFTIESLLGAGGMGQVWQARDNELGRRVALKFIKGSPAPAAGSASDVSTADDDLARFLREAQTAGRLNHPNIAAIYETGQDPPYIAMQLVEGRTLRKAGVKDPRELVRMIRDAARAVAHAHEQGVIHRDLKPDNIMVTDAGHAFVMDFGLARTVESNQTASGFVVGTPAYMPPEQARGEKVDERADVYALGATLYELLTGRAPFTGSTFTVLVSVVTEELMPPVSIAPAIGDDLNTIILTCMEKERDRRYPSATALADDLDRWLANEPIEAKPVSTVTRIGRKLKRRPSLAIAAAAVAATLLVLVPWLLLRSGSVAKAQGSLLERMRTTAETCLQSALDLRRAGNLDGMERYSAELKAVTDEVIRELPQSGEPHQLFGRMLRAQGREAEALAQQDEALRKDPSLAAARYERVVLLSRRYRERREQAVEDARRAVAMQLAAKAGEIRAGLVERSLDWHEVVAKDAPARDLLRRLDEDLALVKSGIGAAELACAEGLRAWMKERYDEAGARLREAIGKAPKLEEAYEALGAMESEANHHAEAVRWWTAGIEQDRGSLNLLLGCARARADWAYDLWKEPAKQLEMFKASHRDYEAATTLAPGSSEAWARRGRALHYCAHFFRLGAPGDPMLGDAIDAFTRAIALDASNAELWRLRGGARANRAAGRIVRREPVGTLLEEAIADLDEAIRLDAAHAEAWAWRGNTRSNIAQMKGAGADADRLRAEAIADFGEALKRDADRPEHWLNRGSTRVEQAGEHPSAAEAMKIYDLALADFGEVLRRWPKNHEAWILRGRAHTNIARLRRREVQDPSSALKAALADLTEAVGLAPVYSDAWEGRGAVRMEMSWNAARTGSDPEPVLKAALADFEEALRRDAANANALLGRATARGNLAEIAFARGRDGTADFRAAIDDCTASLQRKPDNAETFVQRAAIRANLAKLRMGVAPAEAEELFRTAVEDFGRAGELDPSRSDTWVDLAIARYNWSRLQLSRRENPVPMLRSAIDDAGTALKKAPRNPRAFQIRAGVHEELMRLFAHRPEESAKEFELAITDYGAAIEIDPGDGDGWRRRGASRVNRAGRLEGDPRELIAAAIPDFDKAIALNKTDALSFWFRGNARAVRGRWRIANGERPEDDAKAILKDYAEAVRLNPSLEPRLRQNREFWEKALGGG